MQSVRKPDLGLEEIIGMMKTIFVNHSESSSVPKNKESYRNVRGSGSEPRTDNVRESAMTLTCHNNCKQTGHKKKVCKELMGKSDKPSDAENGTRKWCSYHYSNRHSNEDCYQQQQLVGRWCTYHKSATHSDDQCYHQRHGSRNSSADGKSTKDETFVADSNVTGCDKGGCDEKVETKTTEDDEPNNTPPGIGFSFAMCHPTLSQEADGFQILVDPGSSKHFIDPELIPGVESRMQDYTRIKPPIVITTAGNNVLRGTAQGILLVVERGTDYDLRTIKLPIVVLVPGLKKYIFSSSAAAKKGDRTIIEQKGSSLDLGSVQCSVNTVGWHGVPRSNNCEGK